MATHSNIFPWKISWTEEPGGLYSPWGCKARPPSGLGLRAVCLPSTAPCPSPPAHGGVPTGACFSPRTGGGPAPAQGGSHPADLPARAPRARRLHPLRRTVSNTPAPCIISILQNTKYPGLSHFWCFPQLPPLSETTALVFEGKVNREK